MKHAVLIMAHKNKAQLIRLIKSLACDSFDFYVHLDKKWNLSESDISEISCATKNVFVLKKRISVELDKWSMPQAALMLAEYALQNAGGGIPIFCY